MDDKTYIKQLIQEFNRVFLISENFGIEFRQKKTESLKLRCSDILILSTKPLDVAENQGVRKQISEEKAKKYICCIICMSSQTTFLYSNRVLYLRLFLTMCILEF